MLFHTFIPRVFCDTIPNPSPFTPATQVIFVSRFVCLRESVSALNPCRSVAPFFGRQIFSVVKDLRNKGALSHQRRSLRYYGLNKNIVLHNIPGYKVPI